MKNRRHGRQIKAAPAAILCVLCMMLCMMLGGCGGYSETDAAALLQANLDIVYKGEWTDEDLSRFAMTEAEAAAVHEDALLMEAEYFAGYFSVDIGSIGDEQTAEIMTEIITEITELYRDVYAASRYEVGAVTAASDGYDVSLTVWPVDVFRRFVAEDGDSFRQDWQEKAASAEFQGMSQQEITAVWAADLLAALRQAAETPGYLDAVELVVRVAPDVDGSYTVDAADWDEIDGLILAY